MSLGRRARYGDDEGNKSERRRFGPNYLSYYLGNLGNFQVVVQLT